MPLEFADEKDFENKVAAVLQPLIGARMKSTKKEIVDEVSTKLDALGKSLAPQLDEMRLAIENKADDKKKKKEGGTGTGEGDPADIPADPAVKTMLKKLEALEKANAASEAKALAAEQKQQNMTITQRMREVLESSGVTNPNKVRDLMARMRLEGKVRWSAAMEDAAYVDTDNEDLELETGIKGYLGSEEGDYYRDPVGVAGAGTRRTRNGKVDAQQQGIATEAELGTALLRSINGLPSV